MAATAITRSFIKRARARQDPNLPSEFAYLRVMDEAKMVIVSNLGLPDNVKEEIAELSHCLSESKMRVETAIAEKPIEPKDVRRLFRTAAKLFNRIHRERTKANAPSHAGRQLSKIARQLCSVHRHNLERFAMLVVGGYERIESTVDYYTHHMLGEKDYGIFSALLRNAHDFFEEIEPESGGMLGRDLINN